jgi:excisionase family DNA binding protein
MRTILDEEYVTVPEAAKLLRVHSSTIRRWIDSGELPAHRVGQRRVLVKRADLAKLITPARVEQDKEAGMSQPERLVIPKLTPEQQRQGFEAVERAKKRQAEMLAKRGGKLFSPSWELLNEARDERMRQLS